MPDLSKLLQRPINISSANTHDLAVVIVFFVGGACFLWNVPYWAGLVNMGNAQYGDAAFWWNGALHFAEGIIKDNPNLDYRMGYALLSGVFVAVLGGNFFLFHKLLIAVFLFAASFLYFALKPTLGRIAAAGAIALLIFNPFTAEWIAISTSDSTGLILNIAALSCFIFGLRNSLHLGFLAAFGFLLAIASLTRPLMNPFVAPALVFLLLPGTVPWKRRFQGMGSILTAFAVPTLLWVIALHGITGSWAMAGHDSTSLYAASDPQVQVWNGAMYTKVEDSAKLRYKTQNITTDQLNKEFWLLTKENYARNPNYHVSRIVPHILDITRFSNKDMARNNSLWDFMRKGILAAIVMCLAIFSAIQKRWLGVCLVVLVGILISAIPAYQSIVTLASALILAFSALRSKGDHTYAAVAFYWWTGVAVLFLVGGTWGPPLGAVHGMNALGYRLGSQFFFVNDLITVAMLGLISTLRLPLLHPQPPSLPENKASMETLRSTMNMPKFYASFLLSLSTYIFLSGLIVLGITGIGVVSYRAWQRTHAAPILFPQLRQFKVWWQENQTKLHLAAPLETVSNVTSLNSKVGSTGSGGNASSYIVFTGGMSDFVWNFDGQARSQAIVYFQDNISPLKMSPNNVYVEFPLHLKESEWVRKQGAWVVRRLPDLPLKSNLPFYFSETSVKAFVPLSKDKKQFDFSAAQIFPLQKYASQLYITGELKAVNGILEWNYTSGGERYSRRFLVKREPATDLLKPVVLELDISNALGVRSLSFRCLLERAPEDVKLTSVPILKVMGEEYASEKNGKQIVYYTAGVAVNSQARQSIKIDLTQSKHNKVKLILDGVNAGDKIWFYEFNMQADEFLH